MSSAESLAGHLRWQMVAGAPQLHNERPDWVARVAPGRAAAELPGVLAALFSMCAHAHRLTATHAVQAAQGQDLACSPASQRALQLETLREHLRRLWLEWPGLLCGAEAPHQGMLKLAHCPLLRPDRRAAFMGASTEAADAAMDELRAWLQQHVFGAAPAEWLGNWQALGEAALVSWIEAVGTWPARLLQHARPLAQPVRLPCRPLRIDVPGVELSPVQGVSQAMPGTVSQDASRAPAQSLVDWAAELASLPGANRAPHWQKATAETGPWTRLHGDDADRCAAEPSLWWRMGARLADIARLALPDSETRHHGRHALQAGALALPNHEAVAWTETARGLLMHWVRLDATPSAPSSAGNLQPRVLACQVVSPTEWNFHAQGQAASAVQAPACTSLAESLRLIPVLLAAYDPCVPVWVDACDGSPWMRYPPVPAPQPKPQEHACTS